MTEVIILGTANAVSDEKHENTHFAISSEKRFLMVDCVGNPLVRLKQAGLDYRNLTDLFLTHFHPDHVSAVPLLLMNLWLMGHSRLINIYGLHPTLDKMETLMDAFGWQNWPNFFPVAFHRLPSEKMTLALEDSEFRIYTSPVKHLIPAIGLRVEVLNSGKILAYSCDTAPCKEVEELAAGADVLIHEATGDSPGHSPAIKAGEVAQKAGAKNLYLIHYDTRNGDPRNLVDEARKSFPGEITLAEDFMKIQL
ncbi:MAG: MBL fold metallo-hydrolase [Anaerolineales bacterium]|nr:MBL fold metallo-hydrolase [Chloroflexota bacterium]MBL6981329.1 MBL fold metallo-hydrolase [Anaerolineales bacterium]